MDFPMSFPKHALPSVLAQMSPGVGAGVGVGTGGDGPGGDGGVGDGGWGGVGEALPSTRQSESERPAATWLHISLPLAPYTLSQLSPRRWQEKKRAIAGSSLPLPGPKSPGSPSVGSK